MPAPHGGAQAGRWGVLGAGMGAQVGCPSWVAEGGRSVVAVLGGRGHQTMRRSPPRSPKADENQLEGRVWRLLVLVCLFLMQLWLG